MDIDEFSLAQRFVHVGDARVAHRDDGAGPPVLLLHGCPFSSFVWRKVIPQLAGQLRCIAPDLLGLGDTETPPNGHRAPGPRLATARRVVPVPPRRSRHAETGQRVPERGSSF